MASGLKQTTGGESIVAASEIGTKTLAWARSLTVAAVQFPFHEALSIDSLLVLVERFIKDAKDQGAELVLFPELIAHCLIDFTSSIPQPKQQLRIASEFTPLYRNWLRTQAKEKNLAILGGTTPRLSDAGLVNSALFALEDGQEFVQDKIFLTPTEKEWGWIAGTELKVISTRWGSLVITTCFDCEFPKVSEALVKFKPDVILVPSWTGSMHGLNRVDWTARARAVEHFAYVIKTGTVPVPNSIKEHFGQASIYGPQDQGFSYETIQGPLNESKLVIAKLDLELQREKKMLSGYYPGNEQMIRTQSFNVTNLERSEMAT